MSEVYSKHLWDFTAAPSSTPSSPLVPGGFVWVLRDIIVCNVGVHADEMLVQDNVTGNLSIVFTSPLPGGLGYSLFWTGRAVLDAGNSLFAQPAGETWLGYVSGYVLSA